MFHRILFWVNIGFLFNRQSKTIQRMKKKFLTLSPIINFQGVLPWSEFRLYGKLDLQLIYFAVKFSGIPSVFKTAKNFENVVASFLKIPIK